ncbi:MAG: Hpt domain-containing protein [Bacteroidales bacterium]
MKILNRKQFNENFKYFDKPTLIEIISIFQEEYNEKIKLIKEYSKKEDYKNLKFVLHSLKGVISNFDTDTILETARKLEFLAERNEKEAIATLLPDFEDKVELLYKDLVKIKDELDYEN